MLVNSSSTLGDLPAAWRARAEDLKHWAAADGAACALERAAEELERVLKAEAETLLTLTEAAARTGYSRDHIGRLVRTGAVANAGRKNAPKVRLGDLSAIKPKLASPLAGAYDPDSDARGLRRSAVRSNHGS
jgi:hypothetical protein